MIRARFFVLLAAVAILGRIPDAFAARYAVLAANNLGWATENPLHYAHRDANRLGQILSELGGFARDDVLLVEDASPQKIEAALSKMGNKVRRAVDRGQHALFVFYYSGHADSKSLHPGRSSMPYEKLKGMLRRIPAQVRIALLDSCKSGALTRLKGAKAGPTFNIRLATNDLVTGDVFISSAAISENAQESSRLRGSFFSSYVASGLRGAADANEDGAVTLAEMYAYAYAMTVGETSGTRGGTQHPSFRYDVRGRGELVITRPSKATACLLFAKERSSRRHQVINAKGGTIVTEVATSPTGTTRIGVRAGSYKVRQRRPQGVFEQSVRLLANECRRITKDQMRKVILPETLTKGELISETWTVGTGYRAALMRLDSTIPLHRVAITLRAPIGKWAIRSSLEFGRNQYSGRVLDIVSDLWGLNASLRREWATPWGLLDAGPSIGAFLLHQTLDPLETQWSTGIFVGGQAGWSIPLPFWRFVFSTDVAVGDAIHGLGSSATHSLAVELTGSLGFWIQGP